MLQDYVDNRGSRPYHLNLLFLLQHINHIKEYIEVKISKLIGTYPINNA